MAKEYIEREAAYEKCGWYNTVNGKSVCAVRKDELAAIPAADVVEVVHGRWIRTTTIDYDWGGTYHKWTCSVCGYYTGENPSGTNYCPNCGARMGDS